MKEATLKKYTEQAISLIKATAPAGDESWTVLYESRYSSVYVEIRRLDSANYDVCPGLHEELVDLAIQLGLAADIAKPGEFTVTL
jgi:hypothetical protein